MQYRTLGRTGLRVSEIGLGSGGFEKVIDHRRIRTSSTARWQTAWPSR